MFDTASDSAKVLAELGALYGALSWFERRGLNPFDDVDFQSLYDAHNARRDALGIAPLDFYDEIGGNDAGHTQLAGFDEPINTNT